MERVAELIRLDRDPFEDDGLGSAGERGDLDRILQDVQEELAKGKDALSPRSMGFGSVPVMAAGMSSPGDVFVDIVRLCLMPKRSSKRAVICALRSSRD